EDEKATSLGEQIGAAGEGVGDGDVCACGGLRDPMRRRVLAAVPGIEPSDDDTLEARCFDDREIVGRQHAALLEGGSVELQTMRQDGARRLGTRNLAEFHRRTCHAPRLVIPAKAGTHLSEARMVELCIPAFAGMTIAEGPR